MLNQVVLVGRMINEIEVKQNEEGRKQSIITLAVNRIYKNVDGEYETDMIPIILWYGIAENVKEYCKKGDVVGIRGRLQVIDEKLYVIADKVTFLSSKKNDEVDNGKETNKEA